MKDYLPLITGSAGALVVLALVAWAFYIGSLHSDREFSALQALNAAKDKRIERLESALDTERTAVNEQAVHGAVANQLISAVVSLATERRGLPATAPPKPARGLTAEDLGIS